MKRELQPFALAQFAMIVLGLTLPLSACGDELSVSEAERILETPVDGINYSCVAELEFTDGGFKEAANLGLFSDKKSNLIGDIWYFVAKTESGLYWIARGSIIGDWSISLQATPDDFKRICIDGKINIESIGKEPIAGEEFRLVKYFVNVEIPTELEKFKNLIYTSYKRDTVLTLTNRGWEIFRR